MQEISNHILSNQFANILLIIVGITVFLLCRATISDQITFLILNLIQFIQLSLLFVCLLKQLLKIKTEIDPGDNHRCFKYHFTLLKCMLLHSDYTIPRFVVSIYSSLNFLSVAKHLDQSYNSPYISLFVVLETVLVIVSVLIGIYLLFQLSQLFFDYPEFIKTLVYHTYIDHETNSDMENKLQVISTARSVLILCFTARGIWVIVIISQSPTVKALGVMILIESFLALFTILKIVRKLIKLSSSQNELIFDQNAHCFEGYYILIQSIFKSNSLRNQRYLLYISGMTHFISGIIEDPFRAFNGSEVYSQVQYVHWDTFALFILVIYNILLNIVSIANRFQEREIIFSFTRPIQVIPDSQMDVIYRRALQPLDIENKVPIGECCVCLEQIFGYQKKRVLPCHATHIFHYYCISKWLLHHNQCPLCQQPIY